LAVLGSASTSTRPPTNVPVLLALQVLAVAARLLVPHPLYVRLPKTRSSTLPQIRVSAPLAMQTLVLRQVFSAVSVTSAVPGSASTSTRLPTNVPVLLALQVLAVAVRLLVPHPLYVRLPKTRILTLLQIRVSAPLAMQTLVLRQVFLAVSVTSAVLGLASTSTRLPTNVPVLLAS
jgi:hypothetical protein